MTTRKVMVEVADARNLMPKDGEGSASALVTVDFDGQRYRTKTKYKTLNPEWNEKFEFVTEAKTMMDEELELEVSNDKKTITGRRSHFLGRVRLLGNQFHKKGEERLVYYPLQNKNIFSPIKGEIGLRIYYYDEPMQPPDPRQPDPEAPPPVEEVPPPPPSEETPPPPEGEGEGGGGDEATPSEPAPEGEAPPAPPEGESPPSSDDTPPPPDAEEPPAEAPPEEAAPPPAENPPPEGEAPPPAEAENNPPPEAEAPPPSEEGPSPDANNAEASNAPPPPEDPRPVEHANHRMERPPMASPSPMTTEYLMKDLAASFSSHNDRNTYDLVEKMPYLFVRIVRARGLSSMEAPGDPFVKIRMGGEIVRTTKSPIPGYPEWNQIFAFGKDTIQSASILEVSIWNEETNPNNDFLGGVCFDLSEVPTRVPPDSPLAPQWYRLEGDGNVKGDIMLAVWMGTQADETFPEAWHSDTGGVLNTRSKVYLSPKLWYLRVNVIEAQDLQIPEKVRYPELRVRVQLGMQILRTRTAKSRTSNPLWNEDLIFVAAEPFEEQLVLLVEDRPASGGNKDAETLGEMRIALTTIERRVDARIVGSKWYNLEIMNEETGMPYRGRIHLRMCFDGGYHVMDEAAHLCSDFRPTAKQLWKPSIGLLELGILGAKNMLPMKTRGGRGTTDPYCIAKYGQKWIRTRTILDNFNPKWNEQYTWEVYDPCTVLTLGVFDNNHIFLNNPEQNPSELRDVRIGKVRIRISTLESNRVYKSSYPLLVLLPTGVKKMGEIEIAVRFTCPLLLDAVQIYSKPLLPKMHYLHPLGLAQQDFLRNTAMKIVAMRLARAEPPLRQEAVHYMLDTESTMWSIRRSKANWFRIMNVLSGLVSVAKWMEDICQWKNPLTTILVHFLLLILVWYPELIIPTIFFYVFLIGAWHYRFRPRMPPHMDTRISYAEGVDKDELDEEFDPIHSTKDPDTVRTRYDRLRSLAARIQTVLGDFATQGERIQALLSWRDPRSTGVFTASCFTLSMMLYIIHFKLFLIIVAFYYLRHPRFREPMPASLLNFFRRLPALSDRIM